MLGDCCGDPSYNVVARAMKSVIGGVLSGGRLSVQAHIILTEMAEFVSGGGGEVDPQRLR